MNKGGLIIRRSRLQYHFKLELMFGCASSLSMTEQSFECIAVLHFEAIYEENLGKTYRNEIIEFSIVSADVKRQSIVNNLSKNYYQNRVIMNVNVSFMHEERKVTET